MTIKVARHTTINAKVGMIPSGVEGCTRIGCGRLGAGFVADGSSSSGFTIIEIGALT